MNEQLLLTCIAIGVAGAYLFLQIRLAWRGGKNCGGGCGCPKTRSAPEQPPLIASDQLKMRRR